MDEHTHASRAKPLIWPSVVVRILGILIIPLLAVLLWEQRVTSGNQNISSTEFIDPIIQIWERFVNSDNADSAGPGNVIALSPIIPDSRGKPESITITAPANAQLVLYVNDQPRDIIKVDAQGHFTATLTEPPGLPERRNWVAALPVEIDSSTLPVFYLPQAFEKRAVVGPTSESEPPFLASVTVDDSVLQVYGSTHPRSYVEFCVEPCANGHPVLGAESDDEGSFHGQLPLEKTSPQTVPGVFSRHCYRGDQYCTKSSPLQPAIAELVGESESYPIFQRTITLTVSPTDARLVFDVHMPDGYKVYRNLADGDISELEFIEYIFGDVTLNTYLDPRKLEWRQEKEADNQRVRVLIESDPLVYLIPDDLATVFELSTRGLSDTIPGYTPQDQIEIHLKNTRLLHSDLSPTESQEDRLIWVGALARSNHLSAWVSRSQEATSDPVHHLRLLNDLSDSMKKVFPRLPGYPFTATLEGVIIGMLPPRDRVPNPARAQVYDFYRDLYLSDPLDIERAETETFHSFLQDLPSRVPDSIARVLFGGMWLIPSALVLQVVWTQNRETDLLDQDRTRLVLVASGVAILVVLSLDWFPLLQRGGLSRNGYIIWIVAAYLMFQLLFWPVRPGANSANSAKAFGALIPIAALSAFITWVTAAGLPRLPDGWVSIILSGLSLLSFASLVWLATLPARRHLEIPAVTALLIIIVIAFALSIPIQALPLAAQLRWSFGVFANALPLLRPLLPVALLVGIATTLRRRRDETQIWEPLSSLERGLGCVLFVAFAIGLSPSWSFIPIQVLLGIVLFQWIVPRDPIASPPESLQDFVEKERGDAIADLLKKKRDERHQRSVEDTLRKLLKDGKLKEYKELSQEQVQGSREAPKEEGAMPYPNGPASLTGSDQSPTLQDLAFRFGPGPTRWDNARQALGWGVLLLIPLLSLNGWPLVSSEFDRFLPYPLLDIGVRLGVFVGQYLAMALFLGYFFPDIRGRNGLEKGAVVAGLVIISLLPVHLVLADSGTDLLALLVWAGTVLAYNVLIGVIAFDLETLSNYDYGWGRLRDVYDSGEAVASLTGSGVPFVAAIYSAAVGTLDQLVPAVLKVMFPALTFTAAQNELLKALLDLFQRLAGAWS